MRVGSALDVVQVSDPATPQSGRQMLYFKSDGHLYTKTPAGTVVQVDGGGGATAANVVTSANATANKFTVAPNASPPAAPATGDAWLVSDTSSTATGVPNAVAKGDLVTGTGPGAYSIQSVGANNTLLVSDSAQASGVRWATPAAATGIPAAVAKGDSIHGTGAGAYGLLTVGANNTIPVADSTQATGVRWAAMLIEPYVVNSPGTLVVVTGKSRIYLEAAYAVETIRAAVNTAPTGSSVIVDVKKNGTTLFTTQANRPTIAVSGFLSTVTAPDVTTFAAGDYITVDVAQVGSTVAGADLTVTIRLRRT